MYPSPPDMTSIEEASLMEEASFTGDEDAEEVGFNARPPCPVPRIIITLQNTILSTLDNPYLVLIRRT